MFITEQNFNEIGCKMCEPVDCRGCNIYTLYRLLSRGRLNAFMDNKRSIDPDKIDLAIEALSDIRHISDAFLSVLDEECCEYGKSNSVELAEKWMNRKV